MAITYSNLKLAEIASGTEDGTWGDITNANITVALEEAIVGRANAAFPSDSNYTLPWTNTYATQVARNYVLNVTGSISATRELIVPAIEKPYLIQNNTTGGNSILVKTLAGTGVTVPNGKSALVYTDATNVVAAFNYVPDITVGTITLTAPLSVSNGGTGATSFSSGGILRGNGTSAISVASASDIVSAIGATAVTNATNATNATTATNVAGGAANRILYNTAAGATSFIAAPTVSSTYLQWDGASFGWASIAPGGVTAVTGTAPVASSGGSTPDISLAANYGDTQNPYASKTANFFLAAPNGTAGAPTFRAIVAADIPTLNQNTTGNAATATGIAGGGANRIAYNTGTGTTSFITAPTISSTYLRWNGSAFEWGTVSGGSGTVTSVGISGSNISVSGSPVTTSGTISISIPQSVDTSANVQFGGLGVGTSGASGQIRATGNITAYYSDDRLKTRLGNITNAVEKILQLETFYYEANETAQALGYEKVREVGLSAQQVQSVLPEIVKPAPIDDKYLTIQYERLVPLLVQAVKELAGMIPGGSSANPGTNRTEG